MENIDLLVLWGHMESRLWRLVEAAGEHPKSSILQRINDKLRISVEVSVCGRHQIHRNPWRLEYRQGCSGRSRAQRHADSGGRRASAQSGHRHSCVGENKDTRRGHGSCPRLRVAKSIVHSACRHCRKPKSPNIPSETIRTQFFSHLEKSADAHFRLPRNDSRRRALGMFFIFQVQPPSE